jgi:hypothetical protein
MPGAENAAEPSTMVFRSPLSLSVSLSAPSSVTRLAEVTGMTSVESGRYVEVAGRPVNLNGDVPKFTVTFSST